MPQIRCPNCGKTISLENRRETDFTMIVNALKSKERSFTELLRVTKLPRKTLSIRLRELQSNGVIVKKGGYHLNGVHSFDHRGGEMRKYSVLSVEGKAVFILLALVIGLPVTSHVLAAFIFSPQTQQITQPPQIIGTFTATIEVRNVVDVYSWQAEITYDASKLEIIEVRRGDFLGTDWPFFLNASDVEEGMVLLFGTLYGEVPGRSGSGQLAVIVFGYYSSDFEQPEIIFGEKTWLLNSDLKRIPVNKDAWMLKVTELP